jgi:hypothetical protein
MADSKLLYFHAPCFDGLVSGAILWDFLEHEAGWRHVRPRGVNYGIRPWWPSLKPKCQFAVVDFLFHPRATYWADHHATTFLTDHFRRMYESRRSQNLVYDGTAPSCSKLLWEHLKRACGYRNSRFEPMVEWATKIDAAKYSSVDEAFESTHPALTINLALTQVVDPRDCNRLLRLLKNADLETLAAQPTIRKKADRARRMSVNGLRRFKKRARLVNSIVVFDVDARHSVINRYAPYRVFPSARYSAGIIRKSDGVRITAMRNPWKEFKSVPLGRIFQKVGGGGHRRVATVVLKASKASEAPQVLKAVVSSIRQHDRLLHRSSL